MGDGYSRGPLPWMGKGHQPEGGPDSPPSNPPNQGSSGQRKGGPAQDDIPEGMAKVLRDMDMVKAANETLRQQLRDAQAENRRLRAALGGSDGKAEGPDVGARIELGEVQRLLWPFLSFWLRMHEHFRDSLELDGADFQEIAVACGLLEQVPYDPEKHGDGDGADPGDPWYVPSDIAEDAACYREMSGGQDNASRTGLLTTVRQYERQHGEQRKREVKALLWAALLRHHLARTLAVLQCAARIDPSLARAEAALSDGGRITVQKVMDDAADVLNGTVPASTTKSEQVRT
ncbi:hypothetical protein [Dichotomicrobium thermohalophilum]|uniref:Uncharacterized protein n=1 Tax=Dichotomicrobium thermohalophilum TaxID=933063 RepID=A0A397Q6N9_9HYPH|nr:hypothetical protein [Dichotomicrobium thermohalophilum]RIA56752.1 hypothetical protein BXY53_1861 [Dichotomicrobium thermohalophilum]